jgi:cold shock CspA family protein
VKYFDQKNGIGFIIRDDGRGEVLVHMDAVIRAGLTMIFPGRKLGLT